MGKAKKNKKQKKLGSLLLLLFLTVIMLATSTYAWFTANKTVTIQNIDIYVSSSTGLQISTNATDWKTLISNSDITTGYTLTSGENTLEDKNMFPQQLAPVSTVGAATGGYLNMYSGVVAADEADGGIFKLTSAKLEEAKGTTGSFVAFDVFVKTDKVENLYLQTGSGVIKTADQSSSDGLQYATRIALVTEGTGSANDTPYDLANKFGATQVKILEPNFDGHTQYGITQGMQYYGKYKYDNGGTQQALSASTLTAGTTGNGAVIYDGVKADITTAIPLAQTNATDNSTYFGTVTTIPTATAFSEAAEGTTNLLLYENFPAGVTKIRVYMWVEGQDIDCENNASGAYLTYKLAFTQTA